MTSNEIAYRKLEQEKRRDRESERHNRASEALETSKLSETHRSNVVNEDIGRDRNQATRDAALFKAGSSLGASGIGLLAKRAAPAASTAAARSVSAAGKAAASKIGSVAVKAAPVAAAFVPLAASIAVAKRHADQFTPEEAALEYELINEQAKVSRNARADKTARVRKASTESENQIATRKSYDPRKQKKKTNSN